MSAEKSVLILGSGRLAHRIKKLLTEKGVEIIHVDHHDFREIEETEVEESSMDYARELLVKKGIMNVSAVFLVDGEDAVNIYLLMAVLSLREEVAICASFFNESLVSDLVLQYRNIKVFNPAIVVSDLFVEALSNLITTKDQGVSTSTYDDSPRDSLVFKLSFGFLFLLISGAWFFRITESVDWQRGFYLVITVITSVNFNDATLNNSDQMVQYLRMGLMIATYVYVLVALGFITDWVVKRRTEVLMLGRRRYKNSGHIIVCGLGRVGYAIVKKLLEKGKDVIVIESNPNNDYLPAIRSKAVPVLVGDAKLTHYLIDAGIGRARALISAIDSDNDNLVIGLSARSEKANIRLLLRIFDQTTAEEMKKRLNINYAFSTSFATAKVMCDWIYSKWEHEEGKMKVKVSVR